MVFTRKRARRSFKGRRTTKKRRGVSMTMKRYVNSSISRNIETKYQQFSVLDKPYNMVPSLTLLNGMTIGTAANQRIGSRVTNKFLKINFAISNDDAAAYRLRLIVLWDKQTDGVVPDTNEIFADPTAASNHFSQFDIKYVPVRYKPLMDKMFAFSIVGGGSNASRTAVYRRSINLRKVVTQYVLAGSGSTVVDIIKNSLYLICCTDYSMVNKVNVGVEYLLTYKDA